MRIAVLIYPRHCCSTTGECAVEKDVRDGRIYVALADGIERIGAVKRRSGRAGDRNAEAGCAKARHSAISASSFFIRKPEYRL